MRTARDVTLACRVTADIAAAVEEACARLGVSRSAWLESLVRDAVGQPAPVSPGRHARVPGSCPHPKARVIKGFCYACGTMVNI